MAVGEEEWVSGKGKPNFRPAESSHAVDLARPGTVPVPRPTYWNSHSSRTKIEFLSILRGCGNRHSNAVQYCHRSRKRASRHSTRSQSCKCCMIARHEGLPTPPPPPLSNNTVNFPSHSAPQLRCQIEYVADRLEATLDTDGSLDPDFAEDLGRFIRGSLAAATELLQTKRDLGGTWMAEALARARRNNKNRTL
jgi:hypothetical protein